MASSSSSSAASVKVEDFTCIPPVQVDGVRGQKRLQCQNSEEIPPSKRFKSDGSPSKRVARAKLPRTSTGNLTAKTRKEVLETQPKWQTIPGFPPQERKRIETPFRPRLWTGDREELLAILPEMSAPKCVNGISWLLYENPVMILDNTTYCFEVTKIDDYTIDLTTTRGFTCSVAVAEQHSDRLASDMPPLPDSVPYVNAKEGILANVNPSSSSTPAFQVNNHHIPFNVPHAAPLHAQALVFVLTQLSDSRFDYERLTDWIDSLSADCVYVMVGIVLAVGGTDVDVRTGDLSRCFINLEAKQGTAEIRRRIVGVARDVLARYTPHELASYRKLSQFKPPDDMPFQGFCHPPPPKALQGTVPKPIPQEINALIEAYIFGKPVTVVVSNERLNEHWALNLPLEFGYAVMGFFRILGVEEMVVKNPELKPKSKDLVFGQVRWKFRLRWSAGGEEDICPDQKDLLEHPWWTELPPKGPCLSVDQKPISEPEEEFPTTLKYRELRKLNHEYKWRHDPLQDLYVHLFPAHLLMPFTAMLSDVNFPRGWICGECGRMAFQRSMRRRKCPSSFCEESEPISYYLDLFLLRVPQDRLNLPLPLNTYPQRGVEFSHSRYNNGIQTFSYLMTNADQTTCYIKHIFTGNLPCLQKDAERLLKNVQLELDIVRKPGDNGPHFTYSTSLPGSDQGVPSCVADIRRFMTSQVMKYAQVDPEDVRVRQIDVLAWMTSGKRKTPVSVGATQKVVILLCLGCNIALNVTRGTKALEVDVKEENPPCDNGWITGDFADNPTEQIGSYVSPKQKKTASSKGRVSFTFSLVHGDTLVFFGDDFEYSIKRQGTSFLLTCLDSTQDAYEELN